MLLTFWLANVLCAIRTSELRKVVRTWCALYILTYKCYMCFGPQQRAILGHLNFKKWSEHGVFCALWLANVLRTTAATTFWHLNFQKWSEHSAFWFILTCKCASRHSGVQLFISQLHSDLRTRRFSEPTSRPSRTRNYWKNTTIRDFPNTSRVWIFFLLTLFSSDCTFFWLYCSALLFMSPYCRTLDF